MGPIRSISLATIVLSALGASAPGQIRSFTLPQMAQEADGAVYGQIIASRAFRADTAEEHQLFFTTLTIQGRALFDGRPTTVDVTFQGGFVSPTEGVFNSEAPAADDVRVGNRVVAFYAWNPELAGGVNALMAAHGGIYRTAEGPRGAAVLGRGEGYAVRANARLADLEVALKNLRSDRQPR